MNDIEFKISQFADGELPIEEQGELFKILSIDEEARKIFNEYLSLKSEIKEHYNSIEADLTHIKQPLTKEPAKRNLYRTLFYWSAAAAILVLAGASFMFSRMITMKSEVEALNAGYNSLKSEMEMPKVPQGNFKTALVENKGAVKKKFVVPANKGGQQEKESKIEPQVAKNLNSRLDNIYGNFTQVKITKSDFVIPQMAGN